MVNEYVGSCLPCSAALPHNPPVPLQPNLLPERAWQKLHCDFKGPIGGKYYLHILIDQYSKFPEVDIVKSTSFNRLKPVLDRVFACHGIPETLSCDNGSPYPSHELKMYAKEMGFNVTPVTPKDPQCNGFAENFVKTMCKMLHTAVAEGKDAKEELQKCLMQYRAAPHSTTGKSPAEMLFNRPLKTKLPRVFCTEETSEQKETRARHDEKKMKQKLYFDNKRKARPKTLKSGDQVLIEQKKSTTQPPFDPNPFTVSHTEGNRVFLNRSDGKQRVRDKNNVKKVKPRPSNLRVVTIPNTSCLGHKDRYDDEFPSTPVSGLPQQQPNNTDNQGQPSGQSSYGNVGNVPGEGLVHEGREVRGETAGDHQPQQQQHPLLQQQPQQQQQQQTEDQSSTATNETNDRQQLFVLDANMQSRLEQLTEAASCPETARVTRSRGENFEWSRKMNPDNVLQENEEHED